MDKGREAGFASDYDAKVPPSTKFGKAELWKKIL
jgi:hypothetical protein